MKLPEGVFRGGLMKLLARKKPRRVACHSILFFGFVSDDFVTAATKVNHHFLPVFWERDVWNFFEASWPFANPSNVRIQHFGIGFGAYLVTTTQLETLTGRQAPKLVPLPETDIFAPEKWDGWNTSFLLGFGLFSGANLLLVSGRVVTFFLLSSWNSHSC